MKNGWVSVIIPSHKGHDKVCDAVDSVLGQTYQNVEVIVVDDNGRGSSEQLLTQSAMSKYADNDRVLYIVHDVNKNGSAARNTGFRASKGEYISYLDDDDIFLSDKIEKQVNLLRKLDKSYGLVYCSFHVVYPSYEEDIIAFKRGNILEDFLRKKMRIGSSLILLRRTVVEELGGFDESFNRHQDWEFLTRAMNKYKVDYVPDVCLKKYMLFRNTPDPQKAEMYCLFFLEKMSSIIKTLPKNIQREIYDVNYSSLGKTYLKNRQYVKMLYWAFKTSKPFTVLFSYFIDGLTLIKKMIAK